MPDSAITRSTNGCLTCRHRKKKCDETRPICTRCRDGDFECSGYDHLAIPRGPRKRVRKKKIPADGLTPAPDPSYPVLGNISVTVSALPGLLARGSQRQPESHGSSTMSRFDLNSLSKSPQICALDPDHVIQMFIFYSQPTSESPAVQPFRSVPFSVIHAVADRARDSTFKLKSTYIGARIKKAILEGAGLSLGIRLIDDFQREITSTNLGPDTSITDIASFLDCLMGLSLGLMHIVNTPMAHSLLRKCVPFFLALAAKFPELWADYLSISIRHVLSHQKFEFSHFAFLDTVTALLFGTIPLVHYDTSLCSIVQWPREHHIEWAHGCSPVVVVLLARVNSWRAARFIAPTHPVPTLEEQQEFQACLQRWNPIIEYGDQPVAVMGRLAVQESWKHAVLICMHMGMCGANSADPWVEASVRQITQLAATITTENPLIVHITIPCIIAAAAARREKHRTILRKTIMVSRDGLTCLVRGADFILVLDHLWHRAGAGGRPTTWQDYVDSRLAMLPVEM